MTGNTRTAAEDGGTSSADIGVGIQPPSGGWIESAEELLRRANYGQLLGPTPGAWCDLAYGPIDD